MERLLALLPGPSALATFALAMALLVLLLAVGTVLARGVGAHALGEACARAEAEGPGLLPDVHAALDAALFDIAAYRHEQALRSLKG